MGKIRVYELARDFNMTSKSLMTRLKELNISVGSHVSSLEDHDVEKIKSYLFDKKPDTLEVKRVKPTVIRRRKKSSATQEESDEKALAGEEKKDPEETVKEDTGFAEESEEEKKAAAEPADSDQKEDKAVAEEIETRAAEKAEEVYGETDAGDSGLETTKSPEKKVVRKKVKKDEPAKVISKPVPEEENQSLPQETSSETVSAGEVPPQGEETGMEEEVSAEKEEAHPESEKEEAPIDGAAPESGAQQKQAEKLEHVEETDANAGTQPGLPPKTGTESSLIQAEQPEEATEKEKAGPSVEANKQKQVETEPYEVTEENEKKPEEPRSARRKGKKGKKDTPARIIKLPEAQPESVLTKIEPEQEPDPPQAAPAGEGVEPSVVVQEMKESTSQEKRKRKKRKTGAEEKIEDNQQDGKAARKKSQFRRKEIVEGADLYSEKQKGKKGKKGQKTKPQKTQKPNITTPKAIKRRIKVDDTIVLSELAKRMGIKANELIAKLMGMGMMVTVNQTVDFETASLVAQEFNYEVERASFEEERVIRARKDEPGKLQQRPPVVTIMGHVDHGKTSLLDMIRKTRITEREAGGITQHIGAYNVSTPRGQVVFLDTPGHEAFTSMRARGAKVTDIVVLVVAADDGVMPQTIEAINHSRAAGVAILVAINKMDKNSADPDRVLRELSEHGLVSEDWGGDVITVRVSAKTGEGIDDLLEMLLLQAEMMELSANPDKNAMGYVVEAKLDSGRGPVATILIQEGTLHTGDPVICGVHHGKVRAMLNDLGEQIDEAGPSIPVEVLGLTGVPNAGDELITLEDDKSAKQVSNYRIQKQRAKELAKTSRMSLEKLYEKMQLGDVKDLNLIVKADVHGSIEALSDSLKKLSNEEVTINIIHSATGTITESDISLAAVSNAIIIGFNIRPTAKIQALAVEENVDMRFYNVIYTVTKDISDAILGMMSSTYQEQVMGRAEVREVFHVPKVGTIAGSYITDGKIQRGLMIRLLRDGIVQYEGKISSLRRFKDDVKEVLSGYECGIGVEKYNDIKVNDVLECYYMEEIKPEL